MRSSGRESSRKAPAVRYECTLSHQITLHISIDEAWYLRAGKSYDDCIAEAIVYYTDKTPIIQRAFSWACRKMRGENFLDRVRQIPASQEDQNAAQNRLLPRPTVIIAFGLPAQHKVIE